MKTTEENELIAEFMYPNAKEEYESGDITIEDGVFKKGMLIFGHFDQMRYHKSWDWLMPVVEKIESMKYFFNSAPFMDDETGMLSGEYFCVIQHETTNLNMSYFIDVTGCSTKIEAVYQAVVEFIKWYNKNK